MTEKERTIYDQMDNEAKVTYLEIRYKNLTQANHALRRELDRERRTLDGIENLLRMRE